jgi:hypothetical protein
MFPTYVLETVYELISDSNQGSLDHTLKIF